MKRKVVQKNLIISEPFKQKSKQKKIDELITYFNKHKIFPSKSQNKSLYAYMNQIRQKFKKKYKFDKDELKKLNEIGFNWNVREQNWMNQYTSALESFRKAGSLQVFDKNKPLKYWLSYVLYCYRIKKLSNPKRLLIRQLISEFKLKNARLPRPDYIWYENFEKVKLYFRKHGELPPLKTTLYSWCDTHRTYFHKLSKDKKELFDSLHIRELMGNRMWLKKFHLFKKFYKKHKRVPMINENIKLSQWISRQQVKWRTNKLSKYRLDLLLNLGWKPQQKEQYSYVKNHEVLMKQYLAFIKKNPGRLPSYENENRLRVWLGYCKQKLRKMPLESMNEMNRKYMERLIEVGALGFGSYYADQRWKSMLNKAIKNVRLNQNGRITNNSQLEPKLINWITTNRRFIREGILVADRERLFRNAGFFRK